MAQKTLPWAIAALYLLFLFPTPEFPPYNGDDGSWFVVMGWNLAEYGRYTSDTYPLAAYGHHAAWPPLFAGVIAIVIKLFGLNWVALKLLMVGFGLLALLLLRRVLPEPWGGFAVLLTALSPAYFLYSHHTMTEVPYMVAVAAALWGLSRAEDGRMAFLAGLLAVLAFFTRGYAAIFLPVGLLYFALRPWPWRQRLVAAALYALPIFVAILAWKGYTAHILATQPLDWISTRFGNGSQIATDLMRSPREYLQRLYWFDLRYPAHFMLPLLPLDWTLRHDLAALLGVALLAVGGYGWWTLFRARRGAVEIWLPLAIAFLLVPKSGAARYWLPFLPYLYYYFLHGAAALGRHLPRLNVACSKVPHALLLVTLVAFVWHLAAPDRLRFINADAREFRDVALWAGANLPADAVVSTPIPSRFLAVSGRAALPIGPVPRSVEFGGRARFLMCTPDVPATTCAGHGAPVFRLGRHALYRLLR